MSIFNKISDSRLFRFLKRFFGKMQWLALWTALSLIVPNVMLAFTEDVSVWSRLTNILLPLGFYLLLMGALKHTGRMVLLTFPFMIFAGFQIVLLYLYGGSVIAVDMFLNVATTNVSEATELLANLVDAMTLVIVLYVPPLIWAACTLRHKEMGQGGRKAFLKSGAIIAAAGLACMAVAFATVKGYSFRHETFPVNAASNLAEACRRYDETSRHDELSAGFTYNAKATRPDDGQREVYVFVIGETARGDNWQLGGYDRENNPRLAKEDGVVFFRKSVSESNTTHKSVPMLISCASAETFDSITYYKSIITAFRDAGFSTAFISNQRRNRSYTEHFGNEADTIVYLTETDSVGQNCDEAVFAPFDKLLADSTRSRQLIVVHTYGSHFKYADRYPKEFAHYLPDDAIDASKSNRPTLINAYDNTILYTDFILSSLIDRLKGVDGRTALVYASDHGEDIFDDERNRFLHASPQPTYWQIHQASLVWLSDSIRTANPDMAESLRHNAGLRISPQKSLFPTMMQVAGIESPFVVDSLSLVSRNYSPAPHVYLDDLNRPLPIKECGLRGADLEMLERLLGK